MQRKMTLEEYEKLPYMMLFIPDEKEGGYTVVFPELNGCLSYGEDWGKAFEIAKDALHTWLENQLKDNRPIPLPQKEDTLKNLVA